MSQIARTEEEPNTLRDNTNKDLKTTSSAGTSEDLVVPSWSQHA
jgi:hypothetical protein